MKTISIIVPVYNEEHTVDTILREVLKADTPGYRKEIFVIDDGSTDRTRQKLKKWEKKVQIIYKKYNEGKGSAVSIGLAQTKGDLILIQDADSEYSPNDYPILLAPFTNPRVDVVYGSRFLGPHLSTMYLYALGNKFVTFVTNILFNSNITDMETGYKVMRRKVLTGITIQAKRFDVEPEITVKILSRGYQIYEVPISYFGRKFSEGKKLTWKDGIIAILTILRLRVYGT